MLTFKAIGLVSLFFALIIFVWMACMRDSDALNDYYHDHDND